MKKLLISALILGVVALAADVLLILTFGQATSDVGDEWYPDGGEADDPWNNVVDLFWLNRNFPEPA